uniref:LamG-like jellyroll fold domain-containing protein n=1 Tax=Guillardia theta TaxID=55529 RepID=A0A7S4PGM9_GUITH|mmetsp:Transcript_50440/g.157526  ORF Transcript_50440/g.157526 Transcript_50440/m.157526 type:complete len:386 (+) Transcript_50440:73-1230(+)
MEEKMRRNHAMSLLLWRRGTTKTLSTWLFIACSHVAAQYEGSPSDLNEAGEIAGGLWWDSYGRQVRADRPWAWWRLDDAGVSQTAACAAPQAEGCMPGAYRCDRLGLQPGGVAAVTGVPYSLSAVTVAGEEVAGAARLAGIACFQLSFNPPSSFSCSPSPTIPPPVAAPFSLELWVRPLQSGEGVAQNVLAMQCGGMFELALTELLHLSLSLPGLPAPLLSQRALATEVWGHVAISVDGSWVHLYMNGTREGKKQLLRGQGAPLCSSQPCTITVGGGARFLNADVDEVAFYTKSLSQTQLARHFVAISYNSNFKRPHSSCLSPPQTHLNPVQSCAVADVGQKRLDQLAHMANGRPSVPASELDSRSSNPVMQGPDPWPVNSAMAG